MALTPDQEKRILELLDQEDAQKKNSILASKENFKNWVKKIINGLTDALIDELFRRFVP